MNALEFLLPALGLALFLEGLPWFISPQGMRRSVEMLAAQGEGPLRALGLLLMVGGLTLAWWTIR